MYLPTYFLNKILPLVFLLSFSAMMWSWNPVLFKLANLQPLWTEYVSLKNLDRYLDGIILARSEQCDMHANVNVIWLNIWYPKEINFTLKKLMYSHNEWNVNFGMEFSRFIIAYLHILILNFALPQYAQILIYTDLFKTLFLVIQIWILHSL